MREFLGFIICVWVLSVYEGEMLIADLSLVRWELTKY